MHPEVEDLLSVTSTRIKSQVVDDLRKQDQYFIELP